MIAAHQLHCLQMVHLVQDDIGQLFHGAVCLDAEQIQVQRILMHIAERRAEAEGGDYIYII